MLRIGVTTEAGSNYDPVTNPNAFAGGYLSPVFDTLLRVEDGELAAGLAESWEVEGDVVSLDLRSGVTFHDGAPFDADAVVQNLERAKEDDRSVIRADLATVESITAVDDSSVEITVSSGMGAVLTALAGRAGMMGSPERLDEESYSVTPVGAGPWQVSPESVIGQRMVYTAYEDYWDPEVQGVERIEIQVVEAPSAHSALIGGQIDIGTLEARPDQIERVEEAGFALQTFPEVAYQHIMYLAKEGPLADPDVRRAISLGIDREAVSNDILNSACRPQAGVQALPGADDVETPAQDTAAARALLEEAGYADGVDIEVVVSSAGPGSTILQSLQGQLEPIGVRLSINPLARAQLLSTYVEGRANAYWTVNIGDFAPAPLVAQLMTTMSPGEGGDDELSTLAAQAADAVDTAERSDLYAQWNDRLAETAFAVGLCNLELPYLVREGVEGLQVRTPLHIDPRGITIS